MTIHKKRVLISLYQNPCILFLLSFRTKPKEAKLILKTTNRESACSNVGGHVGPACIEVEVVGGNCTTHPTADIVAVGPNSVERTIAAEAEARYGQFKWRGKSPCSILITHPLT